MDQGFGQDGREVGYAIVVGNPNDDTAFEDSQYQVTALNKAGEVIATDSGFIKVLLPDQTLGVGGALIVDEGDRASTLEVKLNAGDPKPTEPIPTFSVNSEAYDPREHSPKATGMVKSPFNRIFRFVRVSAITYDESGQINGGGFTFLNFVPANDDTGAVVSVTHSGKVWAVELHPEITSLSVVYDDEVSGQRSGPSVQADGFGQEEREVGYGFLVANSDATTAIEGSMYRVTSFSETGVVLGTDEGSIDLLLPNQIFGVGGSILKAEGMIVERIEIDLSEGKAAEPPKDLQALSSENAKYTASSYSENIKGFITNPNSQDLDFLRVSGLAYDEENRIIGGGFTFLNFIGGNDRAGTDVSVVVDGRPASVDLFAELPRLSEIR